MIDTSYQLSGHMILSYGVFYKHYQLLGNLVETKAIKFEFWKNVILCQNFRKVDQCYESLRSKINK